jgi:hypothetical protein
LKERSLPGLQLREKREKLNSSSRRRRKKNRRSSRSKKG